MEPIEFSIYLKILGGSSIFSLAIQLSSIFKLIIELKEIKKKIESNQPESALGIKEPIPTSDKNKLEKIENLPNILNHLLYGFFIAILCIITYAIGEHISYTVISKSILYFQFTTILTYLTILVVPLYIIINLSRIFNIYYQIKLLSLNYLKDE